MITSREAAYSAILRNDLLRLHEAIVYLGSVLSKVELPDSESRANTLSCSRELESVYKETLAMIPPASMQDAHQKYLEALQHLSRAALLVNQFADNSKAELLRWAVFKQAHVEFKSGGQAMDEAATMLNLLIRPVH